MSADLKSLYDLRKGGSPVGAGNPVDVQAPALGAPADAMWGGSGDGTLVALLKYVAAELASTLSVSAATLPLPAGAATQTTLAAVLAKLSADPATQTTLAAVLAKLSADPATQTTLAAVLAKLSADPATQTTLAAVLARLAAMGTGTSADPDFAVAPPPSSATATILSGQALSSGVQVDGKLSGIVMPAAWTTASLTFLGSPDDITYSPIYDLTIERALTVQVGAMVMLSLSDWLGVKYVKLRSGTAAAAVNQAADRTFKLLNVA